MHDGIICDNAGNAILWLYPVLSKTCINLLSFFDFTGGDFTIGSKHLSVCQQVIPALFGLEMERGKDNLIWTDSLSPKLAIHE